MKLSVFAVVAAVNAIKISDLLSAPNSNTTWAWSVISSINISATQNVTLFVPTDAAIAAINQSYPDLFAQTVNLPDNLKGLLSYYTLNGSLAAPSAGKHFLTTNFGATILLKQSSNSTLPLRVTGGLNLTANVISRLEASDGVVYLIDSVVVPPLPLTTTAAALGLKGFKDIVTGATLYSYIDQLSNRTIFIPTTVSIKAAVDAVGSFGFAVTPAALAVLVSEHIIHGVHYSTSLNKAQTLDSSLKGEQVYVTADKRINGAFVIDSFPAAAFLWTDILVTSGVVHLIDAVLVPSVATLLSALSETVVTLPI